MWAAHLTAGDPGAFGTSPPSDLGLVRNPRGNRRSGKRAVLPFCPMSADAWPQLRPRHRRLRGATQVLPMEGRPSAGGGSSLVLLSRSRAYSGFPFEPAT